MPVAILVVTTVLATIVVFQEFDDSAHLENALREESQMRLQSCRDHLVDYFDTVYSTLLSFSLDDSVVAMRRDSRAELQKLYDYQWARHRLTEIYVIERAFKMEGKPFMTFERESENETLEEIHSPEREEDEYREQIAQIRRFDEQPQLQGLLSDELRLCTSENDGETELGYVYSVPIRSTNGLMGIVAGMIESKTILQILRGSGGHHPVLLVSDSGKILATENVTPLLLAAFQEKVQAIGRVEDVLPSTSGNFKLADLQVLWEKVGILSERQWWVVYFYNPAADLNEPLFLGMPGHQMLAGSMVLLGIALAGFVWMIGRRLDEQQRHLAERRQLEWQVQEGSERIQRSIGESIHEDLCQRLTGIAALSTSLSKKLQESAPSEAELSAEITNELKQSLSNALQLADELQHVSLQQHGFMVAVRKLAERAQRQAGIECIVRETGVDIAPEISVATQLYRIVQEAVHNSISHSRATRITIELSQTNGFHQIRVEDNGVGVPEAILGSSGLGLRVMKYRSEMIGARLQILPGQEKGVCVVCQCPERNKPAP